MSWIAEYDTQGREFPIGVHVTKTTGTMTHGVTYVPIEDGRAVRAENAKLKRAAERDADVLESLNLSLEESQAENAELRELVYDMLEDEERGHNDDRTFDEHVERAREMGVEW